MITQSIGVDSDTISYSDGVSSSEFGISQTGLPPAPAFNWNPSVNPSLILTAGSGVQTFTRATTATFSDFESIIRTALAGEPRFSGARRVRNLAPNSESPTAANGWNISNATLDSGTADPNGGTTAYTVTKTGGAAGLWYHSGSSVGTGVSGTWIRRSVGTGTVKLVEVHGGREVITITSSWRRYACTVATDNGGAMYVGVELTTTGDAVEVWHPYVENITGNSVAAPSEYVGSTLNYGAGVSGVRYFATQNGNTVSSNVVTEATGAPIAGIRYLAEPAAQNLCLQSEDFGTTWGLGGGVGNEPTVSTNTTVSPAGTTTADTITFAAAAGSYIYQGASVTSGVVYTLSVWAKVASGTKKFRGKMYDGASTFFSSDLTATTSWQRFSVQFTSGATSAGADFGFCNEAGGGAGDVILWGAQLEAAAFATSYIPTTTVAVTRNADVDSAPTAGNIAAAQGTVYRTFTPTHASGGGVEALWGTYSDATNYLLLYEYAGSLIFRKCVGGVTADSFIAHSFVAGTTYRVAGRWNAAGVDCWVDGVKGTTAANATTAVIGTTMQWDADGNSLEQDFAGLGVGETWLTALTDQQIAAL